VLQDAADFFPRVVDVVLFKFKADGVQDVIGK